MNALKASLHGLIPATMTAFRKDGSLDLDGERHYIDWLVRSGINTMMVCGTGGQHFAMSVAERKQVLEASAEAIAGRAFILAQTGHFSTDTTIELSKHAASLGVGALAIITPYYFPLSEDEYYRHYATIRAAVDVPIVLYHNPAFAGPNFSPKFISRLFHDGIIVGFKDSSGEISRNTDMRLLCGEDFIIIHGLDVFPIESFLMNADGWVAGVANVLPKEFIELCHMALMCNWEAARARWFQLKPFVNFCISPKDGQATHQLQIYHSGLRARGIPAGYTRLPTTPLEDMGTSGAEILSKLHAFLHEFGY